MLWEQYLETGLPRTKKHTYKNKKKRRLAWGEMKLRRVGLAKQAVGTGQRNGGPHRDGITVATFVQLSWRNVGARG